MSEARVFHAVVYPGTPPRKPSGHDDRRARYERQNAEVLESPPPRRIFIYGTRLHADQCASRGIKGIRPLYRIKIELKA
jgi:hypothetical protein